MMTRKCKWNECGKTTQTFFEQFVEDIYLRLMIGYEITHRRSVGWYIALHNVTQSISQLHWIDLKPSDRADFHSFKKFFSLATFRNIIQKFHLYFIHIHLFAIA